MEDKLLDAIDQAESWLDIEGVEGVGDGEVDGELCIIVFVSVAPDQLMGSIPSRFGGFRVILQESGSISAQ